MTPQRYEPAGDGRKQRVHDLWRRDGIIHLPFSATDQAGRQRDIFRALPEPDTVPAARKALQKLQDEAGETLLPILGKCPTFADSSAR